MHVRVQLCFRIIEWCPWLMLCAALLSQAQSLLLRFGVFLLILLITHIGAPPRLRACLPAVFVLLYFIAMQLEIFLTDAWMQV